MASTRGSFAESFLRVGLISGDGGAWYLPRVVGLSRALEMSFTGLPVKAEDALRAGFVSRVVEPEMLLDAAMELAGQIAQQPPQALRMMKRLVRHGAESSLAQSLELAAANGTEISVRGICLEMIERMKAWGLCVTPPDEDRQPGVRDSTAIWRRWSRWGTYDFASRSFPHPVCFAAAFDPDAFKRASYDLVRETGINARVFLGGIGRRHIDQDLRR